MAKRDKYFSPKIFILVILFLIAIVVSFNFGLHWNGTLATKITPKKLTCYGHNNFWETYQVDCYSPLNDKQKKFVFTDHLKCSLITNYQLYNVNSKYQLDTPPTFNGILLIKTDYRNFNLDFDYSHNEIQRSRDPGEPVKDPYVIIQNDNNVINAIRKTKLSDFFGYEYQFITFSKKTGKGIIAWTNTQDYSSNQDSFAAEFFQCE
jgi:hypothetical protein